MPVLVFMDETSSWFGRPSEDTHGGYLCKWLSCTRSPRLHHNSPLLKQTSEAVVAASTIRLLLFLWTELLAPRLDFGGAPVVDIWGINQQMDSLPHPSFILCFSNKYKFKKNVVSFAFTSFAFFFLTRFAFVTCTLWVLSKKSSLTLTSSTAAPVFSCYSFIVSGLKSKILWCCQPDCQIFWSFVSLSEC